MAKRLDPASRSFITRFGRRIRSLREERGWTLESCEERGVVNWRHLQEVEQGKKNVNLSTIVRLAKMFKIHPSDLLKSL